MADRQQFAQDTCGRAQRKSAEFQNCIRQSKREQGTLYYTCTHDTRIPYTGIRKRDIQRERASGTRAFYRNRAIYDIYVARPLARVNSALQRLLLVRQRRADSVAGTRLCARRVHMRIILHRFRAPSVRDTTLCLHASISAGALRFVPWYALVLFSTKYCLDKLEVRASSQF